MVGWDGKCENSALPLGLGLNAECEMPRQAAQAAQSGPRHVTAHN